jgi:hypothetical protein
MKKKIMIKNAWPCVEFVVGNFHYQCDHELVHVTKNGKNGIEDIRLYSYEGKGECDKGFLKPTPEADWEMAEQMAWQMAKRQAKA